MRAAGPAARAADVAPSDASPAVRAADGASPGGWTRIGAADDVPLLEGRSVAAGGRRVAVFRLPDGWAATDAACPHAGGPLGDGIVGDHCVTCPLHNRRFDLGTGRQIGGPDAVALHEVEERDGALWLRLAATHAARAPMSAQRLDAHGRSAIRRAGPAA